MLNLIIKSEIPFYFILTGWPKVFNTKIQCLICMVFSVELPFLLNLLSANLENVEICRNMKNNFNCL